jgi:hypothetical protein
MFSHVNIFENKGMQSKTSRVKETYHIKQLRNSLKAVKEQLIKAKEENKTIMKHMKHTRI